MNANILTILVYDVHSDRCRSRLHKLLSEYGVPVQKSAFEARLSPVERDSILEHARRLLDPVTDRFVMYGVPHDQEQRISVIGTPRPEVIAPKFFIV